MNYPLLTFLLVLIFCQSAIASDYAVGLAHLQNGDTEKAYQEFRNLAERGYPPYMNIVADMHLRGQGVASSPVIAHVWYNLSAAQGDGVARQHKKKLQDSLNPEQLKQSKQLTQEYAKLYLEPYKIGWKLD